MGIALAPSRSIFGFRSIITSATVRIERSLVFVEESDGGGARGAVSFNDTLGVEVAAFDAVQQEPEPPCETVGRAAVSAARIFVMKPPIRVSGIERLAEFVGVDGVVSEGGGVDAAVLVVKPTVRASVNNPSSFSLIWFRQIARECFVASSPAVRAAVRNVAKGLECLFQRGSSISWEMRSQVARGTARRPTHVRRR